MDFFAYTKAAVTQAGDWTQSLADQFSALMAQGHSVPDVLTHYSDVFGHLPQDTLLSLKERYGDWQSWRRRARQLEQLCAASGVEGPPKEVIERSKSADELDALYRTLRICPKEDYSESQAWSKALLAGCELWRACLSLCRKQGAFYTEVEGETATVERYAAYHKRSEGLTEMPAHRWLAARRGEREGLLRLELRLPAEQMLSLVRVHRACWGETVRDRDDASLLEELISQDLIVWLPRMLDAEAEASAIRSACSAFSGLLLTPPLSVCKIAGVFVPSGKRKLVAVIVDKGGQLCAETSFLCGDTLNQRVSDFLADHHAPEHVVFPLGMHPRLESLSKLERYLRDVGKAIVKVRTAGLAEARLPLTEPPPRLSAATASAVVLCRRVLDPLREWGLVDPVRIGVADYQRDLDEERLRAALKQTLGLCRLKRRRVAGKKSGSASRPRLAVSAGTNRLLRSIGDLKPAMPVKGIVSNVASFGAFVDIGLPQEGLVHVSELSTDYVTDPTTVVQIGQRVTAYVLGVDPARGRISLSLKPPQGQARRSPQSARRPASRSEALADLERLFKK